MKMIKKVGKLTYWYESGMRWKIGYYENDTKNGKWTIWSKNGAIESEGTFNNGICISGNC